MKIRFTPSVWGTAQTAVVSLALLSTALTPIAAQADRTPQAEPATRAEILDAHAILSDPARLNAAIQAARANGTLPASLTDAEIAMLVGAPGAPEVVIDPAKLDAILAAFGGAAQGTAVVSAQNALGTQARNGTRAAAAVGALLTLLLVGAMSSMRFGSSAASGGGTSTITEFEYMNNGTQAQGVARTSADQNALNPLTRMNAPSAYSQGFTGAGRVIAVLDDGFRTTHQEFAGKTVTVSTAAAPNTAQDHGTHVAGLAAAAKNGLGMHGMAYDASLFLGSYEAGNNGINGFINEITAADADVWNNSWGRRTGANPGGALTIYNNEATVTSMAAYAATQANAATAMATVFGGSPTQWNTFVTNIQNFQANAGSNSNGGVVVWSNSNNAKFFADVSTATGIDITSGNDGGFLIEADVNAALPLIFPNLEGAWIAVSNATATATAGAFLASAGLSGTDIATGLNAATEKSANGSIVLVSAKCGAAARFCVVADGVQVASSTAGADNAYSNFSGTSMAGPLVAGAVAILRQAFPNLSARDITSRLLATANNTVTGTGAGTATFNFASGATLNHGYSDLFGHGFVDLAAALSALGGTTSRSAAGRSFDTDGTASRFVLSGSFGAGIANRLAGQTYVVKDITNAQFHRPLNSGFALKSDSYLADSTQFWASAAAKTTMDFGTFGKMSYFRTDGTSNGAFDIGQGISFQANLDDAARLSVGFDTDINTAIGFAPVRQDSRAVSQADDGFALGYTTLYDDKSRWASFATDRKNGDLILGGFINSADGYSSAGILAERSLQIGDRLSMRGTLGAMREQGGILGARTAGAFAIPSSDSVFGRLGMEYRLMPNVTLRGAYSMARTEARTNGSFITELNDLVSDSFALGFAVNNLGRGKDNALSVTLSQPLRAQSGTAVMTLPTAAPSLNTYSYTTTPVDLGAEAQEMRLTIGYSTAIGKRGTLEMGATAIQNSGHVKRSKLDYAAGMNFSLKF